MDVGYGVRINCFDTGGNGLPVVILHGLAGSSREFAATAEALPEFRTILIGQSMGGHTAMLLAAARPDLVAKLVLLEGGAGSGSSAENERIGDFFRSWPVPFANTSAARDFLGDGPLARAWAADLREEADGLWPRFNADVMVATMNSVLRPRWAEWESVTAPSLVVYAEAGTFTAQEEAEFIDRGRDMKRVDLAGASHDGHLDSFDSWIIALRSFLLA